MFLVAVPRQSPGDLAAPLLEESKTIVEMVGVNYRQITQLDDSYEATVYTPNGASDIVAMTWDKPGENSYALKKGLWSVTAGVGSATELVESMVRRAGRLLYREPVWGSYASVLVERDLDRLTAWQTSPSIEVIYYGQTPSHTFVGSRPFLVALALTAGSVEAVELSNEFLVEYLLYGYSMTEQSPFSGVSIVPANKALSVVSGEIEIVEFPVGLESNLPAEHSAEEAGSSLAKALRNAMDRCVNQINGRGLQIRVSGGKDSRMLLGLTVDRKVQARGVTFGQGDDDEVLISNYLAAKAEVDLEVSPPPMASGESLQDKVITVLRATDGIPLSEPHASIYAGSNSRALGEGIMLGQWPLMKGGAASKMFYSPEAAERKILSQGAAIVRNSFREPYDNKFRGWIKSVKATSDLEKLYLFSRNFRSSRWMIALTTMYDRDATVVYPLADAEVTAVSDALNMGEKIGQSAYFFALKEIWPTAARAPVVGSSWKFEAGGPSDRFDPEGYEDRNKPIGEYLRLHGGQTRLETTKAKSVEFLGSTAIQIAGEIVRSPLAPLLESILTPEFWTVIVSWSQGGEKLIPGTSRRITSQLMWRVYVADVWYRKLWI